MPFCVRVIPPQLFFFYFAVPMFTALPFSTQCVLTEAMDLKSNLYLRMDYNCPYYESR